MTLKMLTTQTMLTMLTTLKMLTTLTTLTIPAAWKWAILKETRLSSNLLPNLHSKP